MLLFEVMYDLIIIGGGPAGVAAGVYAARKQLKTALITKNFGGQSIDSQGIENWIGEIKISGLELAKKLEDHVIHYADKFVDIKKNEFVQKIEKHFVDEVATDKKEFFFTVQTNKGSYSAKTVLVTSGSARKKLPAKNADKFEHKGLTYCASCDGPFFKDKTVVVVGGGNSALESVMQLLAYTKKVFLIHRRNEFRADPVTVEVIKKNQNLEIIYDSEITEVLGEKMVNSIKYKNNKTQAESQIPIDGIFVEIGAIPSTDFVNGLVEITAENHIIIDPWTQRTTQDGIWAAGDVTNVKYHQNNIATGDAVLALEDIFTYLKSKR
ncbi:MAG TPA: FAD-dependent oxidoreductase [Candidatus Paceibacterota bacterium]|nr:FAD-dependent oxidoreductase [Candidatus Paceibacterota bacterium]